MPDSKVPGSGTDWPGPLLAQPGYERTMGLGKGTASQPCVIKTSPGIPRRRRLCIATPIPVCSGQAPGAADRGRVVKPVRNVYGAPVQSRMPPTLRGTSLPQKAASAAGGGGGGGGGSVAWRPQHACPAGADAVQRTHGSERVAGAHQRSGRIVPPVAGVAPYRPVGHAAHQAVSGRTRGKWEGGMEF